MVSLLLHGQTAGHKLTEYLGEIGLIPCAHDNKYFVKWVSDTECVEVMSHSDDLIWFGTSVAIISKHIDLLRKKVPMTPTTWSPTIFRGIEINTTVMVILPSISLLTSKSSRRSLTLKIVKLLTFPAEKPIKSFKPLLMYKQVRR